MASEKIIEIKDLDLNFRYDISGEIGGENIIYCYQCGACSATCPVGPVYEEYDPRKIIRMAIFGLKDELLNSDFLWFCSDCAMCYEKCPQDVKVSMVIRAIQNLASREGHSPPSFRASADLLRKHGRLIEISKFENKTRKKLGIPEKREYPDIARKIIEITDLYERLG